MRVKNILNDNHATHNWAYALIDPESNVHKHEIINFIKTALVKCLLMNTERVTEQGKKQNLGEKKTNCVLALTKNCILFHEKG